jgi:N-acetylglucosaminyl-diphospho-decaprenol L-rhamnosyltransferase
VHVSARVAVVIVTYNSADILGDCLRSVRTSTVDLAAVIVADNASKDDSVAIAEATARDQGLPLHVVQLGRNAGYGAAVNAGIAALDDRKYDAVFVMNPDCRLRPDALAHLADALREPGRGIAVPKLLNSDGSLQPSLRRPPTAARAWVEAIIGGGRAGRLGTLGELLTDPRDYDRPGPHAWATGAAMLISASALDEIGPWEESFLLYSEETDYALRAGDHGWTLWYEPAAEVEHIGGESDTNPTLYALMAVNKVRLFRRRHARPAALLYHSAVLAGEAARALGGRATAKAAVRALLHPSRPSRLAD